MYRFLLPTGIVALVVGALVLAGQAPPGTQKTAPVPTANQQKAAVPQKGVAPLEKGDRRRGRSRVYLGVFTVPVEDMTSRTRKKLKLPSDDGVYVIEVMPDSPAHEAGLRQGDVITHVNGKLVEDENELSEDIHQQGPGQKVDLTVIREGKKQEMKAELAEAPGGAGANANDEAMEEVMGMSRENAQRIERLERRISRLEKRLSEREKSSSK